MWSCAGVFYRPAGAGPFPYTPSVPVLIQAGSADDGTPASQYVALARAAPAEPAVEIDVYEGAHHAFDRIEGRGRYRANVSNLAGPTGRGATVGPHPEARARSLARTTAYLEKAVPPGVPRGTSQAPAALP